MHAWHGGLGAQCSLQAGRSQPETAPTDTARTTAKQTVHVYAKGRPHGAVSPCVGSPPHRLRQKRKHVPFLWHGRLEFMPQYYACLCKGLGSAQAPACSHGERKLPAEAHLLLERSQERKVAVAQPPDRHRQRVGDLRARAHTHR